MVTIKIKDSTKLKLIPKKKAQIMETAMRLFKQFGMKRVTIDEICSKSNVSKMTFYKYFANKIELVKHLLEEISKEVLSKVDEIRRMNIPFSEKIELWIKYKIESTSKYSQEFITDFFNADEALAEFITDWNKKNFAYFLNFVKDAQESGEVRPEIRPEFIPIVLEKLYSLAKDDSIKKIYSDISKLSEEVNNLFFYGILKR